MLFASHQFSFSLNYKYSHLSLRELPEKLTHVPLPITNLRGKPLAFRFCKIISFARFLRGSLGGSRAEESFQHLWWVGALVCWEERLREDGEKGKCSLGLLPCSVTNVPTQSVESVVQDQKPVVGRGWWGSHMQGVSLDCQQRRRKNAWAGCGGNQGSG